MTLWFVMNNDDNSCVVSTKKVWVEKQKQSWRKWNWKKMAEREKES